MSVLGKFSQPRGSRPGASTKRKSRCQAFPVSTLYSLANHGRDAGDDKEDLSPGPAVVPEPSKFDLSWDLEWISRSIQAQLALKPSELEFALLPLK